MLEGVEIVLWLLLIVASATDLIWGKIFNYITFPFLVVGLIYQFFFRGADHGPTALLAVGVAFLFYFPLYLLKVFAAADVKLLMAIGAWSDIGMVIRIGVIGILIGAAVGATILLRRQGLALSFGRVWSELRAKSPTSEGLKMPFAPAFLCAFMFLKIAEYYQWF